MLDIGDYLQLNFVIKPRYPYLIHKDVKPGFVTTVKVIGINAFPYSEYVIYKIDSSLAEFEIFSQALSRLSRDYCDPSIWNIDMNRYAGEVVDCVSKEKLRILGYF